MSQWPKQSECDTYYGNPRGRNGQASPKWESENLVRLTPPWQMYYAGKPIKTIRIHKKCFDSLNRVFAAIWQSAGHSQAVADQWGVSVFGGSYNYRLKRGGNTLSMHSYACAIDLDPGRNMMGTRSPDHFAIVKPVLAAFEAEKWDWLGDNSVSDGMHWQAARA